MSTWLYQFFNLGRSGKGDISSSRKRDRNARTSVAIMNMADSKPRPLPKPRVRQKSLSGCAVSAPNLSCSPPPIVKPKPIAYKPVNADDNKLFVSIATDIDIGDVFTKSDQNVPELSVEKNNNVSSLKNNHGKSGSVIENGAKDGRTTPNIKYSKPLPPLPKDQSPALLPENSSGCGDNSPGAYDMSKLPRKPPRLQSSSSDTQLNEDKTSTEINSVFNDKCTIEKKLIRGSSGESTNGVVKRNPPLPRKPTILRKSVGSEICTSTFYTDSPENKSSNGGNNRLSKNQSSTSLNGVQTSKEGVKMHGYSSDSQLKQLFSPPSQDSLLGKVPTAALHLKAISKERHSNVGSTPPLARKPVRKLSPNDDSSKYSKNIDKVTSDFAKNSKSQSSPNERQKRLSSFEIQSDVKCNETADGTDSRSILEENLRVQNDKQKEKLEQNLNQRKPLPERPCSPPSSETSDKNAVTRGTSEKSRTRRPPPTLPKQTSLKETSDQISPLTQDPRTPPLSRETSNKGPRRAAPGPPKRPSFERKYGTPPPLPNAPRPVSIVRGNVVKLKNIKRSQSEGDIFGSSIDQDENVYTVAYQHLRDSMISTRPSHNETVDNGEYESVDEVAVQEFMETKQQKLKTSVKSKTNEHSSTNDANENKKTTKQPSTTYWSSSDDSGHEYTEPVSPLTEENSSKSTVSPTSTVSSNNSSNYVEPIDTSSLTEKGGILESNTKKYEFKPFNDMNEEWSETKVIDWNYEEESDDSDTSYVEPDEADVFDDESDEAFTSEPLYQIYQAVALEKERSFSLKRPKKGSVTSPSNISRTFTLSASTLRGGKMLWSQLPEVRSSGLLENVSPEQRKFQEAMFEVITSEASYLKSLNLLVDHFLKSEVFSTDSDDCILDKNQISELFSNIKEIVNVSERFLEDLRTRQRQSILIESISDIVSEHATNKFQAYVTYCSSQYKQDRTLANLKKSNLRFAEALEKLERDSSVFGLTLQSFLVLPMQRVTRYPLLVDAIVRRCEPGHKEYYKTDGALKAVNQVVYKCNEGARNEERKEEMIQIEKIIKFLKMNPIKLMENDRWLLRRGPIQLLEVESKSTLSNTLRGRWKKYRVKPIYLFLFSDLLVVTKKKTETMYSVIDYAKRNMIRIQENTNSNAKNAFLLVFLENFEKKTKELSVRADNETDLTRWREAFEPSKTSTDDEKIYGSWDCPQVQALHDYQAQQSDELSLVPGDVVNVLRKLPDGWYEGERIRDGVCGWFPANHTEEIRNEHVRARNLHQRYRLLAASTAFLDTRKR